MFLFFYECIFLSCCRFGLHAYGTMAAVSTMSYLCGLCKLPVKHGDKALQCEGPCSFWFHCDCIFGRKINNTQYKKVAASDEAWYCANCTGGSPTSTIQHSKCNRCFSF